MTSGDIQYGVPTKVFFFAERVPDNCPETPKSANLTSPPAERRMFAAENDASVQDIVVYRYSNL